MRTITRAVLECNPRTMTAVVYHGANDLRIEEVPVPRIRPGELLVRVTACGVCPTDIKKIQHGTIPPPRIFGHETAGIVARVGALARGFRVGDRVALHHHVPCMKCHACRHRAFAQCPTYRRTGTTAGFEAAGGGFAEYVRVMPFVLPGVVRIPDRNSFIEGAMLEPVNTVLKAVRRLALLEGDRVLVAGQGPIGLLFTRILAMEGAHVLATDMMETRLEKARQFGARSLLHGDDPALADKVQRWTRESGLDAAVIAVPLDSVVTQAMRMIRGGGKVLVFAHTRRGSATELDLSDVCVDEKDVIGSYSSDITLQPEVARLVFSRRIDVRPLVSHRFLLGETARAVSLAACPTSDSLKVFVCQGLAH